MRKFEDKTEIMRKYLSKMLTTLRGIFRQRRLTMLLTNSPMD